ncbi:chain length determinant protein tyrosine kinase EpsG [Methylotenera sp.]|uniref:chain length determinant protein tyrosine kinase EpsG n=1 Tax=Methylotenera sp. TaxID=2051956 RepID=UPI00273221BD|nr:chain length determinant protein tyrosine kinase EpsG [Methylotenera sp.]MDP2231503.1 chain length determinant protein tyrosine kinase EpsG [Methylotenera sp.]MDP3331931.1 chain length determinant protein tyrosine kinase EpsG [Methylococcaceae bacterium]
MRNNISVPFSTSFATNPARASKIGRLLLQLGKIAPEDTDKILRAQQEHGLLFGDAALKLGLISEADIGQVLAMQFNYPYLQAGQGGYSDELVAAYQPFSKQVEALRALRSQLTMRWFNENNKSLAIVSANAGEGGSYLAANLAVMFSQLGERTLLIDANMRNPRQHTIFNLKENRGLSDIIAGRAGLDVVSQVEFFEDLSVLGAGTTPPNPQELLNRASFTYFMNQAVTQYDVVLVDTSPASATADAQATVARCGGALLVSRLNHTRFSDIAEVRNQITVTGTQLVGAVINDF